MAEPLLVIEHPWRWKEKLRERASLQRCQVSGQVAQLLAAQLGVDASGHDGDTTGLNLLDLVTRQAEFRAFRRQQRHSLRRGVPYQSAVDTSGMGHNSQPCTIRNLARCGNWGRRWT